MAMATTDNTQIVSSKKETIDHDLYRRLCVLGIIPNETRAYNEGASDYSKHLIQPWSIWKDYNLNPWDADIVKRVLRTKNGESRAMDYRKIIHICEERLRQIEEESSTNHGLLGLNGL